MTSPDLTQLPFDIQSIHAAYEDGLTAAQLISEAYRRIDATEDPGIFINLFEPAKLLSQAEALGAFDPEKQPLWGVPFVVKDNIDVGGHETTAGCPEYAYTAEQDAIVVARLRAAGALVLGKTNLDQFATGLVGVRSPYSPPKNALDPAIAPGGSSSGSAVAVAHGAVCFSLGTDTAGSGRVPAALNNLVGLKPTLGMLSASGVVPACRTLDTVSIFALNVGDAHKVLSCCSGFDASDAYSRDIPATPLNAGKALQRIAIPDQASLEFYGDQVQRQSFSDAIELLHACGVTTTEIDFTPFYAIADMLYAGTWVAERHSVIESLLARSPEAVHPVTRSIIEKATTFSATDAFRDQYKLKSLRRVCDTLLEPFDGMCVPTIPEFCTLAALADDPIGPNNRLGRYTNFVNLLDLCGIAVPVKHRSDGRPGNVTLLGPAGSDGSIATLAQRLQQLANTSPGATSWPLPALDAPVPATTGPDEMEIAVVGAHLSGMPLNNQLTSRGGRLIKTTQTADTYQLFALAGGPPARPGLVASDHGAAIQIEIWALPSESIGSFLDGIPGPLGLGTLELADGSQCKGFICEPRGLIGAKDVTAFGGWRNFISNQGKQS
ncbi:MAG: allophanate hydrolase [Burkholderiaceae bacterium]